MILFIPIVSCDYTYGFPIFHRLYYLLFVFTILEESKSKDFARFDLLSDQVA